MTKRTLPRRVSRAALLAALLAALPLLLLLLSAAAPPQDPPTPAPATGSYAGVEACRGCHPTAWQAWVHSRHARSTVALHTALAPAFAAREGQPATRLTENRFCLGCHGTAADRGPVNPLAAGFHPEEGVTCEACHGPRAAHVARQEKAKGKQAVEPGVPATLATPAAPPAGAAAPGPTRACLDCHKDKPSHQHERRLPFDQAKFSEAIQHGREPAAAAGAAGPAPGGK